MPKPQIRITFEVVPSVNSGPAVSAIPAPFPVTSSASSVRGPSTEQGNSADTGVGAGLLGCL